MQPLSYLELIGFGPNGWGWALLKASAMTLAVALCGFLAGAIIGTFVAWAKLSRNLVARSLADGYTTVLRGIPDLLVIYLFYFGGSAALGAVGSLFGAEGFIGVPAFATGALAIGVVSGAYQAEVFRGAYQTLSKGELEAAKSVGMHRFLMFRRIIAPQVLRYRHSRPRQRLAARAQGIRADLGHGPRRAPAPVADRRRLDAPARSTSTSPPQRSTFSSPGSRRSCSRRRRAIRCAASGGRPDGSRLHARDLLAR